MRESKLTPEQIREARRQYYDNVPVNQIATQFGVSHDTVHRQVDAVWAETRRAKIRSTRRSRKQMDGHGHVTKGGRVSFTNNLNAYRPDPREIERLLLLIPPDTRDVTGVVCGDPLPGRSALDRKSAGGVF